jgi:magnesium-transporting ATPase (P-type)
MHGVRKAIGTLRLAGIKVMMVTNEHPKTVETISRNINMMVRVTKVTLETLMVRTGRRCMRKRCMRSPCMGTKLMGLRGGSGIPVTAFVRNRFRIQS